MLRYVPGATISPSTKGGLEHLLQHLYLYSEWLLLISWPGTCADFPKKQIMISLEHHVVTSKWHKGFRMMTYMWVLKGYKRKMHERMGVPSLKFQTHRAKLTPSRVLQCIQHWVSQEFLPPSWNHVFSSLFYHSHAPICYWALVFINPLCLSDHQVNVPRYKD